MGTAFVRTVGCATLALAFLLLGGCGDTKSNGGSGSDDVSEATSGSDTDAPPSDAQEDAELSEETTAPSEDSVAGGEDSAIPEDAPPADTGPGTDAETSSCCTLDSDCDAVSFCMLTGEDGVCKPVVEPPACWLSLECGAGEVCEGMNICPCGVDCAAPDQAGTCVEEPLICCEEDGDCDPGWACAGGTSPVCKPTPEPGECWSTEDCSGVDVCVDILLCPCGLECDLVDTPGTCQEAGKPPGGPGACCVTEGDEYPPCAPGLSCLTPKGDTLGTCHQAPADGFCYVDSDCGEAGQCKGASICNCLMNCVSSTGFCSEVTGNTCCGAASPCSGEQVCVGPENGSVCKDPATEGCWNDLDCGANEYCKGAVVCACNTACVAPDQQGFCAPSEGGGSNLCCASDSDCMMGATCAVESGASDGTCEAMVAFGECYNDSHCNGGSCINPILCACTASCKAPPSPGICGPPSPKPPGCCSDGGDCLEGQVCAFVPTMGGPIGAGYGRCLPKPAPGECWTSDDCANGTSCLDPNVCGCGALCILPDDPGTCG